MPPLHGIEPKSIKPTPLEKAHGDGQLFVHMFETAVVAPERRFFFEVMAGKPGSYYHNIYHDVSGGPDGHPALPTTLLIKDKPVPLFLDVSQVGLLLDAGGGW